MIREKYNLVHVPGSRRCLQWAERCRREMASGVPAEAAGRAAAQAVFPYEAKGRVTPDAASVTEMLSVAASDDG
jgi:hypothetical protein